MISLHVFKVKQAICFRGEQFLKRPVVGVSYTHTIVTFAMCKMHPVSKIQQWFSFGRCLKHINYSGSAKIIFLKIFWANLTHKICLYAALLNNNYMN